MQPYFFPYLGYYRLLRAVKTFVIFDNAQFPRRGRVHRFAYTNTHGSESWMTLNVEKAPQGALVSQMVLRPGHGSETLSRVLALPRTREFIDRFPEVSSLINSAEINLCRYLEAQLYFMRDLIAPNCEIVTASSLRPRRDGSASDYILEVGRELGATTYVNSPGGKDLYSSEHFASEGMGIEFLSPYLGSSSTVLQDTRALTALATDRA
jgi:hypothetical protein